MSTKVGPEEVKPFIVKNLSKARFPILIYCCVIAAAFFVASMYQTKETHYPGLVTKSGRYTFPDGILTVEQVAPANSYSTERIKFKFTPSNELPPSDSTMHPSGIRILWHGCGGEFETKGGWAIYVLSSTHFVYRSESDAKELIQITNSSGNVVGITLTDREARELTTKLSEIK
jgi:hypothetical protein